MSRAIDALTKRFAECLSEAELVEIEWPTLNEVGTKVYARRLNTGLRVNRVLHTRRELGEFHFFAESIINFALDEEGKHLFSKGDKSALMTKCDSAEIIDIGSLIASVALPDDEDHDSPEANQEGAAALKNSKATQT